MKKQFQMIIFPRDKSPEWPPMWWERKQSTSRYLFLVESRRTGGLWVVINEAKTPSRHRKASVMQPPNLA